MRLSSRTRARAWYVLPVALCAAGVAACGSVASTAGSASSTAAATPSAAGAKASLIVEVTSRPGAKVERWTLQCEPTGGTQPDAAAACHQLLTAKRPFAPIPHNVMCPMIPADAQGEQTATIEGTWFGTKVDAAFSQHTGCSAARWSELGHVFTPVH